MKKEYDFSNAKRNPYTKKLKQQVTIRLDIQAVKYFKDLAESSGIPYQQLINLFLKKCADEKLIPETTWKKVA